MSLSSALAVIAVILARPRIAHGGLSVPLVSPLTALIALALACALAAVIICAIIPRSCPHARAPA